MLLCLDEILLKSAVLAKFGLGDFLLCDSTKFGVNIMNERCVLVTKFHALGILFLSAPLARGETQSENYQEIGKRNMQQIGV